MNRHAAAGTSADPARGRRIIVITQDVKTSREALEEIAQVTPTEADMTVRRADGAERISYPTTGGDAIIRS